MNQIYHHTNNVFHPTKSPKFFKTRKNDSILFKNSIRLFLRLEMGLSYTKIANIEGCFIGKTPCHTTIMNGVSANFYSNEIYDYLRNKYPSKPSLDGELSYIKTKFSTKEQKNLAWEILKSVGVKNLGNEMAFWGHVYDSIKEKEIDSISSLLGKYNIYEQ